MACCYISILLSIQKFDICLRFPWSMTHGMLLHFLYYSEIWHLHEVTLVNDTWHAIIFPILFRNLTCTWDFLGQWHMACCYITYAIQKFDIYLKFPWSTTHGMPLYFLYYSEIWHLHEISLVSDTWHAVTLLCYSEIWHLLEISMVNGTWHAITFPILFINLTFT